MIRPRPAFSRVPLFVAVTLSFVMLPVAQGRAVPADTPRAIEPVDILGWKTVASPALSADGKWFAYRFRPVEGDATLIVRSTDSEKTYRFGIGETPAPAQGAGRGVMDGASDVAFADDGQWVAFTAYPTRKEAERLKKQRKPIQTSVHLVNLSTGADVEVPKVRQFAFSGESSIALAMHRYGPDAPAGGAGTGASAAPGGSAGAGARPGAGASNRPKGADLIVRDLASGTDLTIGSVSEFAFDKPGRHLAWTIDAEDKIGNGISVRDLKTGIVTTLDSGKANYEKIAWTDTGDALGVLKGTTDRAYEDKLYAAIGVTGLNDSPGRKVIYDPAKDTTFPAGMTISANRAPEWTDDRAALIFGIVPAKKKERPAASVADLAEKSDPDKDKDGVKPSPDGEASKADDAADDEEKADLVLWHWKDKRLQSQQQVQEDRDKRFSFLATWRVADKKFVRLADDTLRDVTPPKKGRWAVGLDRQSYELMGALDGRSYQDVYAVDLQTGARTLAAKQVRWYFGQSPDSTKLLYYDNGHFFVYDIASSKATNITQTVPVSFVDVEDDHNMVKPPVSPEGWTADSKSVLLTDAYDVWQVAADGSAAAVNLTVNGRRDRIRYSRVAVQADEKGVDLSVPQYYTMLGAWTKKGGIARVKAPQSGAGAQAAAGAEVLAWDDASYDRLTKAKRGGVVAYTRETAKDFPDVYVASEALKDARKLTDGQSQLAPYAWWSGAKLIEFTSHAPTTKIANGGTNGGGKIELTGGMSTKGQKLQAALYLPANYEPGRKYPTIVYIYERLTDNFNRFTQPETAHRANKSFYTSQGYAVLQPDIAYTINDPGMSAVWCVLPALDAAIATGIVDPARVGIQGHSWGGYQTAFLVTQTNKFKAAIAGAPLTNMVSMYSLVFKNSGGANMAIFESSQGRFRGGYMDNWDAYVRNSPIVHASKVTTPLVILHNDKDGAVDFTQGIEYYNTLRRLKKPVVLLQYAGENHGLAKPANKFDYMVRMKEFFDFHLKGAPAPDWWTDGVSRLDMDKHLKGRQPKPKKPAAPVPTAASAAMH